MLTRNSGSGQSWPWTCDLLLIFLYSSRFEQVVALDHFEARSKTAADKLLINRIGPPVNHGNWICIHMYTWHRLTKQVHRYWSNWHSDHGKNRTCIGSRLGSRFMKGSPQLADLVTCAIAIVYKVLTKDLEYLSISGWPSLSFFFWWTFWKKYSISSWRNICFIHFHLPNVPSLQGGAPSYKLVYNPINYI